MLYYRCKCGEKQAWGSMPPASCDKCEKCGSNLATGPDCHYEPSPHNWIVEKVETDDGDKGLTRCLYCGKTRKEIEGEQKER